MQIRHMKQDDVFAISYVYEASWKYAYKGIIPEDYLKSITSGKWVSSLNAKDRNTLVLIENNQIIGTSSYGRSRFEKFKDMGEIISIYLLPQYIRKGYRKLLLNAVIDSLTALHYQKAFLWVLEENYPARRFYEKFGFINSNRFINDTIGGKSLKEIQYIFNLDKKQQEYHYFDNQPLSTT